MTRAAPWMVGLLPVVLLLAPARAQSGITLGQDPFDPSNLPPVTSPTSESSVPRLLFELLAEMPLPGRLTEGSPQLVGDEVRVPVAGGVAVWPLEQGVLPRVEPPPPEAAPPPDGAWAVDAAGRFRCRTLPEGWVVAERRCGHCRTGWKSAWKLRLAGSSRPPPLIHDGRVYFGALDNQVYSVKQRNGHRVWATDVGARASSPLVLWIGEMPATPEASSRRKKARRGSTRVTAILVVPGETSSRRELVALGAAHGQKIGTLALTDDQGTWVGVPLATPDGKLVLARQKYSDEALLMLYRVAPAPPASRSEPSVDYNAPATANAGSGP